MCDFGIEIIADVESGCGGVVSGGRGVIALSIGASSKQLDDKFRFDDICLLLGFGNEQLTFGLGGGMLGLM